MTRVFADAFYFIAFLNARDAAHQRALDFASGAEWELITTRWVLVEVADGLASHIRRSRLTQFMRSLEVDRRITILPDSDSFFEEGLDLFAARPDKAWSLTDCISFAAMREQGLTEALTGDHHFEQAGFVALLR